MVPEEALKYSVSLQLEYVPSDTRCNLLYLRSRVLMRWEMDDISSNLVLLIILGLKNLKC